MNKRVVITALLLSALTPVLAVDYDYDDIKSKAMKELQSKGKGGAAKKIDAVTEPPKSRFVNTTPNSLSEEDKRYILVHMKLANRSFANKKYDKAKEETEKVFTRDASHAGAHFMMAVIAGRFKEHQTAWYHIGIAKEKDSGNAKINDFLTKLKSVSKEPDNPPWIPSIYRDIEVNASERTFDLIEKLMGDECSANITYLQFSDIKNEGSDKSSLEMILKARDSFSSDKILSLLRKANGSGVAASENSNTNMKMKITFKKIDVENKGAKAIKKINDFVADLIEEMPEIAISNTEEGEPKNGVQEVIYNLSAREFSSLNSFMRKISPFATSFILQSMELDYIPGSKDTIWNAKIKVFYKI